ncbi:thioredoxin-related transmembrane protein 3 [Tachypleus tridentatus]|uniref:thioredoxin-related transmembrane protein 3 n=1 Tax=Tachypleus tridentatus TaxID=6853 RepID=UPI003FD5CE90
MKIIVKLFYLGITLTFLESFAQANRVLELSDRFLEVRHQGVWLIKFYAPWCGHCKNLEPIFNQVAQSLVDSNIQVGRLDCTRFTSVATEFGIRGFPTVIFVKGHKNIEYKGDRTREEIVDFARRMDGPAVRHLKNCDDFQKAREDHKVLFLYVDGEKLDDSGELKDHFMRNAEELQPYHYFFTVHNQCLSLVEGVAVPSSPSVYVFKDNKGFQFKGKLDAELNTTLKTWINQERFPAFLKVTNGNFPQVLKSEKYIVLAVLEENQIGQLTLKMQEFKDLLEAIAVSNRDLYHEHFIFGWLGQSDLANSVAMKVLPIPSLIVVDSSTYEYYLPPDSEEEKIPSPQTIISLLDQILNKSATAYGGNTLLYRLKRVIFEASTSLSAMWKGNPVLTTVLFGLPLGFLSIIIYTSCCSDILEMSEEEEDIEESQRHHKKD